MLITRRSLAGDATEKMRDGEGPPGPECICNTGTSYLLVAVGDVSDFIPWEGDLGGQLVIEVIDVKPQSIHSKQ